MRRLLLVAMLLSCTNAQASQPAGDQAGLRRTTAVFVGWVDISPNDWMSLGYGNKQQWTDLVTGGNEVFQQLCQRGLQGYEVVGAKNSLDDDAAGRDLHVKFSEVRFDVETYALYAAISVIDVRTGAELARIPKRYYRGGHFSVISCLNGAFEKLAQRVAKEVRRLEKRSK